MCMCTYVYLSAVAWGGQKGPWDPLQLELQAIVSTERQNPFLWVSEEDGSRLTPKAFFNGENFMICITNTIYISKQDTGGRLTVYSSDFCVLLFIFSFIFCNFIPGGFHPCMQWNTIISAPPHLSLQLPFSPNHHISFPTSYTLLKTFSVDHMWVGVRQTPGARETPPSKEWYSPPLSNCQLPIAPSLGADPWAPPPPIPCWTVFWLHVVQVLCRCAHEHKAIFQVFMRI